MFHCVDRFDCIVCWNDCLCFEFKKKNPFVAIFFLVTPNQEYESYAKNIKFVSNQNTWVHNIYFIIDIGILW